MVLIIRNYFESTSNIPKKSNYLSLVRMLVIQKNRSRSSKLVQIS